MKPFALVALATSILFPVLFAAGCSGAPAATKAVAAASPATPAPASASAAPVASVARVSPPRPPPPVVVDPMAGAPSAAALGEARLVTADCEDMKEAARPIAEARILKMWAEVNDALQDWVDEQPYCWQQYREQAAWEKRQRRLYWRRHARKSYGVGSAVGFGGLGLSGIGEGGGGRGEGIGLDSVGGLGRGAGAVRRPAAAKRASGTNNQVAGVHEADIVKNDGRYVYIAMNGALRIIEAMNPRVLSITKLRGKVREMFIEGDRAVVYVSHGNVSKRCTYGYDCQFAGDGSTTEIVVLDVANRSHPKVVRKIDLSGSLMAARRVGRTVHTVVADGDSRAPQYQTWPPNLPTCGTPEKKVRALFAQLKRDNARKIRASMTYPTITEVGEQKVLCENLLRTPIGDGKTFTTVVSFDLTNDTTRAHTATIQSRPGAVFASANALYLSVVHQKQSGGRGWYSFYSSVDEVSDVHKFRIGERPSDTSYVGSGVVPGHVLNQFSMDEYYGYLRIATTKGRVPNPKVESAVSILAEGQGGNLVLVGAVDHIAPGEDIRSVRFDSDRGYIVTFKKTDPLFVLDLYHPAEPAILGELKIPGFSTYMHRIDPDHLLSIGFDADDMGSFAYFDGVILQLFDVSEPTQPKLIHKEKIGTRGSSSEAATNHLAFNYFADKGLLAFPMTVCEGGGKGSQSNELTFSGLLVYDVSVEHGFKRRGGVDHGTKGANCGTWWSNANSHVKRSIFLDELVYSIAPDRLKVQRMGHFGEDLADIALL